MKNKILYIVATQYDNMGDLLINKCLIDELANFGEIYLDTKKVPYDFKKILLEHPNSYELSTVSTFSFKGKGLILIPFIKKNKYSHLFKSPGPFGGAKTTNDKIRYFLFYYLFFIIRKKGVKSYLIGNDIIINSKFDAWIFKKYSIILKGILVRSTRNVEVLKKLHLSNVEYSPDLCFLMNSKNKSSKSKKVAISFRNIENDDMHEKIIQSVKNLILFYSNKNYQIVFFHQVDRDYDYNKCLFELFKEKSNVNFRTSVLTWNDRDFYNDIELVLSNRLHVLLLAQSYSSIPIALLNENLKTMKINDVFESISLKDLIYNHLSVENLKLFYDSRLILIERITKVNQEQKIIFKKQLSALFE